MPGLPDPDVLYPEIAAAGSLAGAVQAAAVAEGLTVVLPPSTRRDRLDVASPLPCRGNLVVDTAAAERSWRVDGCQRERGMSLVEGCTTDLAAVARAVQAWQAGAVVQEILAVAPFLRSTGRFDVPDEDPVRMVASEWKGLLTAAARGDREVDLALLEAVYADPRLRQLYPFTSMWRLMLSTSIRYRFRCPLPWAQPSSSGGYAVTSPGGVLMGVVGTVDEVVAMIRSWLADGDVPAVLGPDQRPVPDPLAAEAHRRFDGAGDEPWFRVEATTTVEDWQRLFDLFARIRRRGGRWWRYAEGGVERDLPATAAEIFARPAGAPPATVRKVFPPEECPVTFHVATPDEIWFTVNLRQAGEERHCAFGVSLMDLVPALPRAWLLMAPQDDRTRPVLAVSPGGFRLL